MRSILAVLVLAALALAQAEAKQVTFDDSVRGEGNAPAIFMDRAGELYPPAPVRLDVRELDVTGGDSLFDSASDPGFATLRALYRWKSERPHDPDWPALLAHAGITPTGDFSVDWENVQAILRQEAARKISDPGKQSDVVLLVHGYNNSYKASSAWYGHAEQKLRAEARNHGRDITFVRLYWDGLDGRTPIFIWTKAQYNGYIVGVELRRILSLVDGTTALRIFTHSSGAFVVTNALGDGSASAQLCEMPADYPDKAAGLTPGYAPPLNLRDLRVAMLIPAQPTTAFGNYFRQATPRCQGPLVATPSKAAAVPSRLLLGVSKHDLATSKTFIFPCTVLGSSCMAVRVKETCAMVPAHLHATYPRVQVVEFVQWPVHGHGVDTYTDDPEWPRFAGALFAPTVDTSAKVEPVCPVIEASS